MPIESPQLDDLRHDRVVADLVRRIPVHAPEWTDHNDSDPGITLIQLFAYLAEQVGYRLNRVPEKNKVELLKLLGVRLQPASAARSRLALFLSDPSTLTGYTLAAGATTKAKKGAGAEPPPTFETDDDVDVVPAEPTLLVTTKNPDLRDVLLIDAAKNEKDKLPDSTPKTPSPRTDWLTVLWDGKKPKPKDLPVEPVTIAPDANQRYLWVGINFNPAADAGFRGVRVTLTVQLDDDEQPNLTDSEKCGADPGSGAEAAPPRVDWLHYYDQTAKAILPVGGRIDDTTGRLARSGTIRFSVPAGIGPIPDADFKNLRDPSAPTALETCLGFGDELRTRVTSLARFTLPNYRTALTQAVDLTRQRADKVKTALPHPLDPQLRGIQQVKGWLRIDLPSLATTSATAGAPVLPTTSTRVRAVTFNAVAVTNAQTVRGEVIGVGDGRPGQAFQLANRNVLPGTLELAVQEDPIAAGLPLVTWEVVDSLDPAGPFDRKMALDAEAGRVQAGDGERGMIVPLVPAGGRVVALKYKHGGGEAGEVAVGQIAKLDAAAPGVAEAVNFVAARGGRDAETQKLAEIRARKEISTRSRAVTAGDFEWIATRTPDVRIERAHVVPLRAPLPPGAPITAVTAPYCGQPTGGAAGGTMLTAPPATPPFPLLPQDPQRPAGLDEVTIAHGAVSVVVVPDVPGPEPVPTPSVLRAVCRHLDDHRLVTTEVFVVPPQFARLCNFVVFVKARPGYTRAALADLVSKRLADYLHVLRGGEDGKGYPFGTQVHVADLIAQVFRVEGVERVESLTAEFTRTKTNADPRQGRLVMCPAQDGERSTLSLAPEETVSVDLATFTLSTVS